MANLLPDNGSDSSSKPEASSTFESMKQNSLKVAGYGYLVGDAALFGAGLARGDHKEAFAGLLWAAGGLAAARYGNPESDKMLEILGARLGDYLREQGVEIPKEPTTAILNKQRGVIDRIEEFLYAHPSEVLNATYAIGGAQMIGGAFGKGASNNKWSAVSGALVTAGALAGLLLPEKKPDPENPPQGIIGKAVSWMQEKPLRVSGTLYGLNNAALIMGALKDRKTHPGNWSSSLKFLTAGSYIFANSMLSLSSKGHSDNSNEGHEAMSKLADASAHMIAAQPPQVQEALVQRVSAYLSAQPEAQMKADDISKLLHDKLKQVSRTVPAPTDASWQQRVQSNPPAVTTTPAL
jgi:hypothetical protein